MYGETMPDAWLVIAAGDDRQHGGNDGYADEPAHSYSWDDTVANHSALSAGDAIALWDKHTTAAFALGALYPLLPGRTGVVKGAVLAASSLWHKARPNYCPAHSTS
jgi:hypothetical protein